jgi:membrane dipeptidase
VDRPRRDLTAVFDGHNDVLGRMQAAGEPPERFVTGLPDGQLDLSRARVGGLAGGLFAINAPSEIDGDQGGPLDHGEAAAFTAGALGRAHALAEGAGGAVRVVVDADELDRCRDDGALAMVLHLEGAEAIDTDLAALDAWYVAGVRSLGLVWSRPSAFGHGVPFRFPSSSDTGPGLTDPDRALVRRCAQLGVAVDVSHLNAAGFADVARLRAGPIVASHCGCHALCAASRNLTDDQLREVARSHGIVGIVFTPPFIRADGREDPDTPVEAIVAHVRHAVDVAGIDHVGLGSDFDGAPMLTDLPDAAALPRLIDALRDAGFTGPEVDQIAWGNWRRVLALAWGG